MGMNIALREPHLLSVKISQLLLIRYSQCYDDTAGECGHCHSSRVHFHLRSIRVPDKFSRYGANEEFQQVNFQCSHQIIINFLLICRVMSLTLSGFWPETPWNTALLSVNLQKFKYTGIHGYYTHIYTKTRTHDTLYLLLKEKTWVTWFM